MTSIPLDILAGLVLSAALGFIGQGVRAAAGVKKRADEAAEQGKAFGETLDKPALYFSLFIGALSGMLAFLGLQYGTDAGVDFKNGTAILGLISAGYSGADFIEAFAKRYMPK